MMLSNLLTTPLYKDVPAKKEDLLLTVLKQQILQGLESCSPFRNLLDAQRVDLGSIQSLAELPFLPVSVFKREQPLCFLTQDDIYRILESSATTGQQPSRIAIDRATAQLMTKGVTAILADYIGTQRRPYLVFDQAPGAGKGRASNARLAAVQGLLAFATEICYALRPAIPEEELKADPDGLVLDLDAIEAFCMKYNDSNVIAYGFTYAVYLHLGGGLESSNKDIKKLMQKFGGVLLPKCHILHSGGWKKLQQLSVNKEVFNHAISSVLGNTVQMVIDYYGMVEQLGVIYPDCSEGNKHAPRFAQVIIRTPLDWSPSKVGETGIIQVLSALSPSFPGQSLLTEDMGRVIYEDGCPCGRAGIAFRFVERVPKAEIRGCSDVQRRSVK